VITETSLDCVRLMTQCVASVLYTMKRGKAAELDDLMVEQVGLRDSRSRGC